RGADDHGGDPGRATASRGQRGRSPSQQSGAGRGADLLMHLRRLDLVGFKSFANRTTFLFEPGISVLCGPNGSGKSNVSDAVRWALGEQSARAIRGRTGEYVIFVGSQGRQPLGLAEVSLTLDNSDGRIPLDY